jgi:hypothetical protein
MVNADLGAAQAAEIFHCLIGASAIEAVGFLMVDALHFEALMQSVPCAAFVRVYGGALPCGLGT